MFSFHKPKVYRSTTGCCICKAKSSSSRFTDSKKYEEDFIECFQLEERRTGEICNACVLLVKRWKKLPAGSNRNWRHVVDARAGPGIKSLTKFKSKNKKKLKDLPEQFEKIIKKKHVYLKREQSPAMSDDLNEDAAGNGSKGSSRSGSPAESYDIGMGEKVLINGHSSAKSHVMGLSIFMDLKYFKRYKYCGGMILKGLCGEVITESKVHKSCRMYKSRLQVQQPQPPIAVPENSPAHSSASASPAYSSASTSPAHSLESATESAVTKPASKTFSDSSSDSGYDESSNQGLGESKIAKFITQNSAPNLTVLSKPAPVKIQPIKSVQLKTIPSTEAIRLKTDVPMKLVPIKQIDQLVCKPVSLVTLSNSTSHPATAVPANPLVDFAMHASSRQSISN